jgi:hypothetical protein
MRKTLAALTDGAALAAACYGAFRLGDWATPCGGNQGKCAPLAPVIVACILLALGLYFSAGYLVWKATPAQRLFGLDGEANHGA